MGGFSLWHWLIVGLVILLLFGKGRFSDMMSDVAKGLKSFKKGIAEEEESPAPRRLNDERTIDQPPSAAPAPAPEAAPAAPAAHGSASEADRH